MGIKGKIGVQLYSIRDICAKDFRKALEVVASIGYDGVEFAGFYGWSADDIRDTLRELGLMAAGAHVNINELLGDNIYKTIEFHRRIDNKYIIVPGLPQEMRSNRDSWIKTSKLFIDINNKLRQYGIILGYHNHREEFQQKIDSLSAFEFFFSITPDIVMQIDIGHALAAGNRWEDIIDIIKRFPGRIKSVHIKDYSRVKGYDVFIGEGDANWREIINVLDSIGGTEWYIVEQETYKQYSSIEAIKIDLHNLRKIIEELR